MDSQSIEHKERLVWNQLEFALNYLNPSEARIATLKSQLERKLLEGHGEVQYSIGLSTNGEGMGLSSSSIDIAISTLKSLAFSTSASLSVLNKQPIGDGMTAQVLIRRHQFQSVATDIRVALIGETQVGKSTLVGSICRGVKDNGKGSARNAILRHQHERRLGCTSSITQHLIGFDSEGKVVRRKKMWPEAMMKACKLLSLIDLPGNDKYRNTLLYGLISQIPDYCILMINPNTMKIPATIEYINLIIALKLPFFIIFSKADHVNPVQTDLAFDLIRFELLKHSKMLLEVLSKPDAVLYSRTFLSEDLVPLFQISFKTQQSINLLLDFLNLLPSRAVLDRSSASEFYLEKWFIRENTSILGGMIVKGNMKLGERVFLGPDTNGGFSLVTIVGIHVKEVSVASVSAGQFCSFQIEGVHELRRGMVLLDYKVEPRSTMEFECIVWTIDDSKESRHLKTSYKPLIYTQTITQCVYIVSGPQVITPHAVMKFKFHFLYHSEYLAKGTKIMIRDTFMTALGTITNIV